MTTEKYHECSVANGDHKVKYRITLTDDESASEIDGINLLSNMDTIVKDGLLQRLLAEKYETGWVESISVTTTEVFTQRSEA